MLFDRYTSDISYVRNALNKKDAAYCNPSNYYVTEEECLKYLNEIKTGQDNNDKWNAKRNKRVVRITLILCSIMAIIFFFVSLYLLHLYAEGWEIVMIPLSWFIFGAAIGVFFLVNGKYGSEYIWSSKFFPPVNIKIEKLFDDYLWKMYLLEEEGKKQNDKEQRNPQAL